MQNSHRLRCQRDRLSKRSFSLSKTILLRQCPTQCEVAVIVVRLRGDGTARGGDRLIQALHLRISERQARVGLAVTSAQTRSPRVPLFRVRIFSLVVVNMTEAEIWTWIRRSKLRG